MVATEEIWIAIAIDMEFQATNLQLRSAIKMDAM